MARTYFYILWWCCKAYFNDKTCLGT